MTNFETLVHNYKVSVKNKFPDVDLDSPVVFLSDSVALEVIGGDKLEIVKHTTNSTTRTSFLPVGGAITALGNEIIVDKDAKIESVSDLADFIQLSSDNHRTLRKWATDVRGSLAN